MKTVPSLRAFSTLQYVFLLLISLLFIVMAGIIFSLNQKNQELVRQLDISTSKPETTVPILNTGKQKTSCEYNGKTYKNGETFPNNCNSCSCENGQIACTTMACQ